MFTDSINIPTVGNNNAEVTKKVQMSNIPVNVK